MLTIDNAGIGALADFPLLVVLDSQRIRYSASGADLRFFDASMQSLAFEIEAWNPNGKSYVWVRVPAIAANVSTTIWMYYDNPTATDGQNTTGVWDASYVGVWHLADAHDSTGQNASTSTGGAATAGMIGSAWALDGNSSHYIDTQSSAYLAQWTIEAWIDPTNAATNIGGNGSQPVGGFPNYLLLWDCNSDPYCETALYNYTSGTNSAKYAASAGAWSQVAAVFDGTMITTYVGGVNPSGGQATATQPPLTMSGTAVLGLAFLGALDEIRISKAPRSQDYFEASTAAAADNGYVAYGPEQAN